MSESARETARHFFRDHFGLDERSLGATLDAVLERKLDYADLFFEYTTQDSMVLEESIVKSADRHVEQGVGVRAQCGERQGYAHSDDDQRRERAAWPPATARAISDRTQEWREPLARGACGPAPATITISTRWTTAPTERARPRPQGRAASARWMRTRAASTRSVKQVMASCDHAASTRPDRGERWHAGRATSSPLVRLNVQVIAESAEGDRREVGYEGTGRTVRASID